MIETIKHVFGGGIYLKIWKIQDNTCVPQHKHKFEHLTAVFSGCVLVEVEGEESKVVYAPDAILVRAGLVHCFTALNGDATIGCIHSTDVVDPSQIDMELIEP